jgi:hypothetical protein
VFVTPNNKIDAVIEHSLRNIFLRAVFDSEKVNPNKHPNAKGEKEGRTYRF